MATIWRCLPHGDHSSIGWKRLEVLRKGRAHLETGSIRTGAAEGVVPACRSPRISRRTIFFWKNLINRSSKSAQK